MSAPALFLHSSWRSSSTYVWAKYRAHPGAYAYFEPLAEHLAAADNETINGFVPWQGANHPPLAAPYHEEFRPLLRQTKGVVDFPASCVYGHFRLDGDEELPDLRRYFDTLCAYAHHLGKRPVMGLVRSALRVGWFRKNFAGHHVFIRRDPRTQFMSCLNQVSNGSTYFIERPLVILCNNFDDPLLTPLCRWLELPHPGTLPDPEAYFRSLSHRTEPAKLYAISYYLHLLSERSQDGQCDAIIDIDAISQDSVLKAKTEQRMRDLTGLEVSFADCKPETYTAILGTLGEMFQPVEASMRTLLAGGKI